jgi:cytochrome c553
MRSATARKDEAMSLVMQQFKDQDVEELAAYDAAIAVTAAPPQ